VDHVISSRSEPCGILLFLSGTQEIRRCVDVLKASGVSKKAELFQLHANLPGEEQQLVFKKYKNKIIVSTNVAEVRKALPR
jgi:ATP-dependent RNA helicase DHX57